MLIVREIGWTGGRPGSAIEVEGCILQRESQKDQADWPLIGTWVKYLSPNNIIFYFGGEFYACIRYSREITVNEGESNKNLQPYSNQRLHDS